METDSGAWHETYTSLKRFWDLMSLRHSPPARRLLLVSALLSSFETSPFQQSQVRSDLRRSWSPLASSSHDNQKSHHLTQCVTRLFSRFFFVFFWVQFIVLGSEGLFSRGLTLTIEVRTLNQYDDTLVWSSGSCGFTFQWDGPTRMVIFSTQVSVWMKFT
jgi:hypothetical protein